MKQFLIVLLLLSGNAYTGALDETRYCGPPERLADGTIKRRADVIRAFKRIHPCPATGLATGPCPWEIDHVLPLDIGGCDAVFNLQYLPPAIKSCAGRLCKDRWERRIYANPIIVTPLPTK